MTRKTWVAYLLFSVFVCGMLLFSAVFRLTSLLLIMLAVTIGWLTHLTDVTITNNKRRAAKFMADTSYEHELRLDGVNGFVMRVDNNGQQITVSGWCGNHRQWNVGDRILLIRPNGKGTRYSILNITRPGKPPDQYFMNMQYNPRPKTVTVAG